MTHHEPVAEMTEQERYELARKRVNAKMGFFHHLGVYLVVNIILVMIWLFTGADYFWPIYPILGWGIGLLMHGLSLFVWGNPQMMNRLVEKELEKMNRQGRPPTA